MSAQGQKRELDFPEDVDAPSPDPHAADGKKRRTATASSRGVANLTPEQLAKKRANDREAQRAIRERTKNQIENLEKRIKDLTSQQPYQELQHVIRQKELVEAENADIKRRLSSVISLLQPILGTHGPEPTSYPAPAPTYISHRPSPSAIPRVLTPNSASSPVTQGGQWQVPNGPMVQDPRLIANTQQIMQVQQLSQQKYELEHNLDIGPERLGLEFLLDGISRSSKLHNGTDRSAVVPMNYQELSREPERESPRQHRSNSVASSNINSISSSGREIMGHSAPIQNSPSTCPLDSILLDFLHERQHQAAEGVETPKLVGPAYPSVSSLLNPSRSVHSHPLSKVFTDILTTFPDLATLPEQVAVLYIMFLLMRWQIAPTQENYDRLPDWIAPRPSQLFTPHPTWIDHLPWPKMRDRLVNDYNPRDYLFENFFIPYTTTLSVNWPYEPTDTLLSSPENDELMINPVFERHLRRLENWSLGPEFAKRFPGLANTCRIKTEGDRRL